MCHNILSSTLLILLLFVLLLWARYLNNDFIAIVNNYVFLIHLTV